MKKQFCEFCEIINKGSDSHLHRDESVVAFHDIDKASAKEHVLVCPVEHLEDISTLNETHIPLIEKMLSAGTDVLKKLAPGGAYRYTGAVQLPWAQNK